MKFLTSLPMKLLLGVIAGIAVGQFAGVALMNVVVTVRYILGQLILFCVPLIIIGFIAPSITRLGNNASKMLGVAVTIAYISSIGAALFSMAAGYIMIPNLSIVTNVEGLQALPDLVFKLDIPPIMSVMSALALSMCLGLAAAWTKAKSITNALEEFQLIVLAIVTKIRPRGVPAHRPRDSHEDSHPASPVLHRLHLLLALLRRQHHEAAPGLHPGHPHRHGGPLHLDGAALRPRGNLHRQEPV